MNKKGNGPMTEEELIRALTQKDEKAAYAVMQQTAAASAASPEYYPYLGAFASLLGEKSSYVRTRAFMLCCAQARWDSEGRLDKLLPRMCALLTDEKPTVVRQCLGALREVILYRPELSDALRAQIGRIDLSRYKESMAPLIKKDMEAVLKLLGD